MSPVPECLLFFFFRRRVVIRACRSEVSTWRGTSTHRFFFFWGGLVSSARPPITFLRPASFVVPPPSLDTVIFRSAQVPYLPAPVNPPLLTQAITLLQEARPRISVTLTAFIHMSQIQIAGGSSSATGAYDAHTYSTH